MQNRIVQNGDDQEQVTLVLGGTGKTGRRVVQQLRERGIPVRVGSRTGTPPFDWNDPQNWDAALQNVNAVYIVYYPDLAVPGASDAIDTLSKLAVKNGVERLVLLSGRGEEEAQRSEAIIQNAGVDWTVVRASWFSQNFSEGFVSDMILYGDVALPAGSISEPFIDVEDIADVVVAALTEDGHAGQVYEVTGPRLLTFAQAIEEIAIATGRPIRYQQIPHEVFTAAMTEQDVPADVIALLSYLFTTVLDGRNEKVADGVQRALGRQPRDFSDYVKRAVREDAWPELAVQHVG